MDDYANAHYRNHAERGYGFVMTGRGWLKNGNPPGDPSDAPRCGARTRSGSPCRGPAMANGRCRMHGGKSTGPKTPEGKAKCAQANLKHGRYTKARRERRREARAVLACLKAELCSLQKEVRQYLKHNAPHAPLSAHGDPSAPLLPVIRIAADLTPEGESR